MGDFNQQASTFFDSLRVEIRRVLSDGREADLTRIHLELDKRFTAGQLTAVLEKSVRDGSIEVRKDEKNRSQWRRTDVAEPPKPARPSAVKAVPPPYFVGSAPERDFHIPASGFVVTTPPPAAPETAMPSKTTAPAIKSRDRILQLLAEGDLRNKELVKALKLDDASISYHLGKLAKSGAIARAGDSVQSPWHLANGKTMTAAPAKSKRALKAKASKPVRVKRVKPSNSIDAALDDLQARLQRRAVDRLDTKRAVLDKLARIVDPTIADVLTEISADLAAA